MVYSHGLSVTTWRIPWQIAAVIFVLNLWRLSLALNFFSALRWKGFWVSSHRCAISLRALSPSLPRQEILPNNTLVIREAKEPDRGRYTCIASDREGQTAMADTFLRIISEISSGILFKTRAGEFRGQFAWIIFRNEATEHLNGKKRSK